MVQHVYSNGVPVLAYVIFRCVLQWKAFDPTKYQILNSISSAIEAQLQQVRVHAHSCN